MALQQMDPNAPDPFFVQFNPANASPTTGINGGNTTGGLAGSSYQSLAGTHVAGAPLSTTGPPLPQNGTQLPGSPTGQVDPALWQKLTAGFGVGNPLDHSQNNTLMQGLQAAGYAVQPGPIDSQGRQDSLVINGQLTRLYDSSGKWNPVVDNNGSAWGGQGGAGGGTNADWLAPFTGQATMPSLADFQASPGYQAGLDATNKGVQASAAAKGDLLTGGTLRKLGQADANYVTNGYGQFADRTLNNLNFNRQTFYQNQDSPFSKLFSLSQLGKPAS